MYIIVIEGQNENPQNHMISEAEVWGEFDKNGNPIDAVKKYSLEKDSVYLWGADICEAVDAKYLVNFFEEDNLLCE